MDAVLAAATAREELGGNVGVVVLLWAGGLTIGLWARGVVVGELAAGGVLVVPLFNARWCGTLLEMEVHRLVHIHGGGHGGWGSSSNSCIGAGWSRDDCSSCALGCRDSLGIHGCGGGVLCMLGSRRFGIGSLGASYKV